NRLGRYLRKRGVGEEEIVGVMVERGVEMVVGWLGVMKAGGAYMPLDPSYPPERLAFMLNDTGVNILLTQERLVEKVSAHDIGVVCVDKDWDFIAHESAENLFNETDAESVAYVIYTSGSTGKPKGILIPHRAVTRLLCNTNYIELSAADRIAQASNASFDAATFEIWGALIHGAQLVIVSRETMLSPTEFAAEIRERGITVLFLTTALFNLLAREAPGSFGLIRCLLFGGEAVDAGRVREVIKDAPPERLLHVYGPTESTTFATWYRVESVPENAATIPIGRPISNTQAYILDRRLQPMPVGLPGELYLGGEGLAHGYLHRPELTAEKFIPDAFNTQPGARLYKTGDRARFLPDGNIEFLGRVDHQVKLRGFRVELEEIEAVLAEHPSVSEAVVTLREDVAGEKRLVAYVAAGGDADAAQLRGYLRQKLPEYMLPASFVSMEKLPLTPNGKVNRRALPVPDEADTTPDTNFIAPRNTLEFQLAQIWEEVLDVRPVGVADNFFDLGGHSLLAVRLMAQIRRRFGRDLPLDTLFKGATVESLAAIIGQEGLSAWSPLVAMQRAGSKSPFFCVHPAGGNIICYIALVHHLGLAQPFYALQARGLDGREQPLTRIEDMAAYYIDALQRVQPQGPYLLGGWSLGGVIAFEMARQLHAEGHEIALLALIDSGAPTPSNQQAETDEATLLAALALDFGLPISEEDLRRLNPDERLEYFLVQGRKRNVVPPDYDLLQARRLLYIYQTNVQAFRDYRPRPYPNRITLFRASETPVVTQDNSAHTSVSDAASGWSQLSSQPLDIHDVPGDHISMIAEPHVRVLATQLQRTLEASLAKAEVY
ncbi:MAG TPA: amino acid adenylation domain-containing protein, partial [Pyrinomonadaceae bacterium]